MAPLKEIRIKNNSQEWFDRKIYDKMENRDILLRKFQKSKTHIDEDLYKSAKYNLQKLIKIKKRDFYQVKLTENIGKPKELWKTLKSLGLPSKKSCESKICLKKMIQ